MKIYSLLIAIFLTLILSSLNIGLEIRANYGYAYIPDENLLDKHLSDFNLKKNEDLKVIDVFKDVSINMEQVSEYSTYEQVDDIEFSGTFRVKNSLFHFTMFSAKIYSNMESWVKKSFPPFTFNEENFSENFFNKKDFDVKSNLYKVVTKVKSGYYLNYLSKYEDHILVLSLQLGYYNEADLDDVALSINPHFNLSIEDFKMNLNDASAKINQYENKKSLSWRFNNLKVKADSIYYLPWTQGQSYSVTQDWGANDPMPCTAENFAELECSHYGINGYAYDFGLSEGVDIRASAAGTVTYVKSTETACGNNSYINNANYVVINHSDGKATNYYHLSTVNVAVNNQVTQGQVIGKAGKTGFTYCNAHLHFQKQSQGGSYTQSEAFYFAEYPNVANGELVYPSIVTSQNESNNPYDLCSLPDTTIHSLNVNSGQRYDCITNNSVTILPEVNFYNGSDVRIRIE